MILNIVNPTAGFLDGDRLRIEVQVETGARLLLTTPSASRAHTMRGGRAIVTQRFQVAAGASLEWWPEMLIPQRAARYEQQTQLYLQRGAELIFQETLAPGRVASGEVFVYDELRWSADLWRAEQRLIRERFLITPNNGALTALRSRFPHAYYTSIFVASSKLEDCASAGLLALQSDTADLWSGVSRIAPGLCVIKLLSADSLTLRRALTRCRHAIYACLARPAPSMRRAGDV